MEEDKIRARVQRSEYRKARRAVSKLMRRYYLALQAWLAPETEAFIRRMTAPEGDK
jgi:hypothetical protein